MKENGDTTQLHLTLKHAQPRENDSVSEHRKHILSSLDN